MSSMRASLATVIAPSPIETRQQMSKLWTRSRGASIFELSTSRNWCIATTVSSRSVARMASDMGLSAPAPSFRSTLIAFSSGRTSVVGVLSNSTSTSVLVLLWRRI